MNITQDPRSFSFPQRTLIGTTKSSKLYRLDNSVSMLTLWFLWSLFMKYSLKMIWEKKRKWWSTCSIGESGWRLFGGSLYYSCNSSVNLKNHAYKDFKNTQIRDFLGGPVTMTLCSQCRGCPVSVPGQETTSHMPQLRVCMLQLRPDTANWINKQVFFKIKTKKQKHTEHYMDKYIYYIHIYIERERWMWGTQDTSILSLTSLILFL